MHARDALTAYNEFLEDVTLLLDKPSRSTQIDTRRLVADSAAWLLEVVVGLVRDA